MRPPPSLASDGTFQPHRMRLFTKGEAQSTPAVRVSRLQRLLKTKKPSICIVRGEGIGDVLTTTPTVSALRNLFPQSDITYATNTRYLDGALVKVLQYNPDISLVIDRDNINESDYDLIINLHCPCLAYEKRGKPLINRIDIFAEHTGVKLVDRQLIYNIQPEEISKGKELLAPLVGNKLIAVQPFPSTQNRSWDHGRLKQTLIELGKYGYYSVIFTHSSGWKTDVLWDNLPRAVTVHNADVRTIASILVHCDLVLCPDSSILHLAGALNVPGVALFGPTPPQARINYYPNITGVWEGEKLSPCPCWYESCPIGAACWANLTVERVVQTCHQKILQSGSIGLKSHRRTPRIPTRIL